MMSAALQPEQVQCDRNLNEIKPVDLVHLSRQTMGDGLLEKELLGLFVIQAENYKSGLSHYGNRRHLSEVAHQLKGSARSIGAWKLAELSQSIEINPMDQFTMDKLMGEIGTVETYIRSMYS